MNLRDLMIFQVAAQLNSINQTAQQLNYVQSNVTSRIKKLERDLQVTLFHRHRLGITLTEEGEKLLPYAQKMIALSEEMHQISQHTKEPAGKLDIASVETVIKLPAILSDFIKKYPKVDVTLSTGVTGQLINDVLQYKIDGAFVTRNKQIASQPLEQVEVFQEKLVLIASNDIQSIDEVLELPLLRFSDGCGYREKLNEWLTDKEIIPTKVMELGTLETTIGSVIAGLGVAYVPYTAVELYERKGKIRCYNLPKKYSEISTVFIYRKEDYITAATKAFISTILEKAPSTT